MAHALVGDDFFVVGAHFFGERQFPPRDQWQSRADGRAGLGGFRLAASKPRFSYLGGGFDGLAAFPVSHSVVHGNDVLHEMRTKIIL